MNQREKTNKWDGRTKTIWRECRYVDYFLLVEWIYCLLRLEKLFRYSLSDRLNAAKQWKWQYPRVSLISDSSFVRNSLRRFRYFLDLPTYIKDQRSMVSVHSSLNRNTNIIMLNLYYFISGFNRKIILHVTVSHEFIREWELEYRKERNQSIRFDRSNKQSE